MFGWLWRLWKCNACWKLHEGCSSWSLKDPENSQILADTHPLKDGGGREANLHSLFWTWRGRKLLSPPPIDYCLLEEHDRRFLCWNCSSDITLPRLHFDPQFEMSLTTDVWIIRCSLLKTHWELEAHSWNQLRELGLNRSMRTWGRIGALGDKLLEGGKRLRERNRKTPKDRLCQGQLLRECFLLSLNECNIKVCTQQASGLGKSCDVHPKL